MSELILTLEIFWLVSNSALSDILCGKPEVTFRPISNTVNRTGIRTLSADNQIHRIIVARNVAAINILLNKI